MESKENAQILDVAPGLWMWRSYYRDWKPDDDFDPLLTSTCVQSNGQRLLLDPQAPPATDTAFWQRLDRNPPTAIVILNPDHIRDLDFFVQRYKVPAYGPYLFFRDDVPQSQLEPIDPGTRLPGDVIALYDGRGRKETPLWVPEHRTLVFADALTALGGRLQVWFKPWHVERVLPALRALLDLPFERVIVSHGDPVHSRAEYEAALELAPWGEP